jgi:hypothetical protein
LDACSSASIGCDEEGAEKRRRGKHHTPCPSRRWPSTTNTNSGRLEVRGVTRYKFAEVKGLEVEEKKGKKGGCGKGTRSF